MKTDYPSTLIVGASENPVRYSNISTKRLNAHGFPVYCFAKRKGMIDNTPIQTELPLAEEIHTITLYVGSKHQDDALIDSLIALKPKRILFNPGTENLAFENKAQAAGIEVMEACTLVLLSTGMYFEEKTYS